jgi:hypothetical protein
MSWESRNGRGRYYTRSRRVGGRIVREYIGCGPEAILVAELDQQEREIRRLEAEQKEAQRVQDAVLDAQVDEISELANLLARSLLLAAGFHHHHGEWRRNREKTEKPRRSRREPAGN